MTLTIALCAAPARAADIAFQVYDVGTLGCEGGAIAYDVNDTGTVVGVSGYDCEENGHAFSWFNGIMTDLSVTSGNLNINGASHISRDGDFFVGFEDNYYAIGFLSKDGNFVKLTPPEPCDHNDFGQGMNSEGSILVGSCNDGTDEYEYLAAVYYPEQGISLTLEPPADLHHDGYFYARDVNDAGVIVGCYSYYADWSARAYIWQEGIMTPLINTLGGESIGASSISNSGFIVGGADTAIGLQAFRYDMNTGEMVALGGGSANAGNERGDAVGLDIVDNSYLPATLYKDGQYVDLMPFLLPYMKDGAAHSINNYGWIVGEANDADDHYYGWLLVPLYDKGDFDGDEDVDLQDFGHFQRCFAAEPYQGPEGGLHVGCTVFDFDDDVDLDLTDYESFQAAFTGPLSTH